MYQGDLNRGYDEKPLKPARKKRKRPLLRGDRKGTLNIDDGEKMPTTKEGKEALIEGYEEKIKMIARKLSNNGNEKYFSLDELVQAGRVGLLSAIEKFNTKKTNGGKFDTFAEHKIRGAILDYIRSNLPVSRTMLEDIKRFDKAKKELGRELNREPSLEEIQERLEVDGKKFVRILGALSMLSPQSLYFDSLNAEEEYLNPNVSEEYHYNLDLEKMMDEKKLKEILLTEMNYLLKEREKTALKRYFFEGKTQKEIGEEMGISYSNVSQIISKAKAKLIGNAKGAFLEQYYKDYLENF